MLRECIRLWVLLAVTRRRFSCRQPIQIAFGCAAAILATTMAAAQTASRPGSRLTLQSGESVGAAVSKDPLGNPCADIEAASRAHIVNPNVYDHVVSVANRCLKPLTLRVCYYNSDRCFVIKVPGNKRKDLILGVFPGLKNFRYSYKEIRSVNRLIEW